MIAGDESVGAERKSMKPFVVQPISLFYLATAGNRLLWHQKYVEVLEFDLQVPCLSILPYFFYTIY
jgi:hypothetical protein